MNPADLEYKILEAIARMKHISYWEVMGDFNRSDMQLLGVACCKGGADVKVSELCSTTGMQPAAVSRSLKSLEKSGLIERNIDPDNRRSVIVSVTPEGQKTADDLIGRAHDYWSKVLSRMSEDELSDLLRVWNLVMDNMETVLAEKKAGMCSGETAAKQ